MNILALETSSIACSVALHYNGQTHVRHQVAPMQQTNLLLPMIDELLSTADVTLTDLDAIAFGAGPGSFTGMRIACSVTQGLAFSANIPVIPISSLAAIAQAAHLTLQKITYLVAVDARMGQVYWGRYSATSSGTVTLEGDEKLSLPNEISTPEVNFDDCVGVGDGWTTYQSALSQSIGFAPKTINSAQLPTAEAILKLAMLNFDQNNAFSATEALPSYLITR